MVFASFRKGKYWELFVRRFLRAVRPEEIWEETVDKPVYELYSPFDEAYAFLLVVNFWDDWTDLEKIEERQKEDNKIEFGKKGRRAKRTIGRFNKGVQVKKVPGWNQEGWTMWQYTTKLCCDNREIQDTMLENIEDEEMQEKQRVADRRTGVYEVDDDNEFVDWWHWDDSFVTKREMEEEKKKLAEREEKMGKVTVQFEDDDDVKNFFNKREYMEVNPVLSSGWGEKAKKKKKGYK